MGSYELKKIDPVSVFKLFGLIFSIFGTVLGFLVFFILPNQMVGELPAPARVISFFIFLVLYIIILTATFSVLALLYNTLAKRHGGIKLYITPTQDISGPNTALQGAVSLHTGNKIPGSVCMFCGSPNTPGARFCISCGKSLNDGINRSDARECPSCNTVNKAGANFCISCGKALRTEAAEEACIATESVFLPFKGEGHCDVCANPIKTGNASLVPSDIFYSSPRYREWLIDAPLTGTIIKGMGGVEKYIANMRSMDSTSHSAVCENCIQLFRKGE